MKNFFLSLLITSFCFLGTTTLHAQNAPEWALHINALPDSAYVFPVRVQNDINNYVYVLSSYSKPLGAGVFEKKIYLNKFNYAGLLLWSFVYDNNGTGQPIGYDMAVDDGGNCYIAGGFTDPSSKPLLLKVSTSGSMMWQRDSTTAFKNSAFEQVFFQNNVLYLKASEGVATFDAGGNELWSAGNMEAFEMAVDYSGQLLVSALQPSTDHTIFRYNAAGVLTFSDSTMMADRITVDAANNIYLLADFPQYELVKYDAEGNFAWSKNDFPLTPGFGDIGFEVVTDYDLDVMVVGLADTMYRFSPDGELLWQKSMNGLDNYRITAEMVYGNFLAVAGTIQGPDGYDMKVVLYNLLGTESWSGTYNSNDIQEFPVDLTTDYYGVYVIEDNISNTTLVKFPSPYPAQTNYDLVCVDSVWYDPVNPGFVNVRIFNGNIAHINYPTVQIISPAGDTISNPNNNLSFFAHLGNGYQVYTDTILVSGITDFTPYTFLMHQLLNDTSAIIDWCFALAVNEISESNMIVYPNPVKENLFIQHNGMLNKNYTASIFSLMGARVLEEKLSAASPLAIDVSKLVSGLYVLRISDGNSSWQMKFVKQ